VGSADNQRQITNVAAGTQATDAVNVQQMQAGDTATLASAKTYTDSSSAQALSSAKAYTDAQMTSLSDNFEQFRSATQQQFRMVDRRIDRMGAMSSAMMGMAANAAGPQDTRGRLAAAVGVQNGQSALAVGWGKLVGKTASVSLGAAFSGNDTSATVGFGIAL
jgi:autotransporter adhesin